MSACRNSVARTLRSSRPRPALARPAGTGCLANRFSAARQASSRTGADLSFPRPGRVASRRDAFTMWLNTTTSAVVSGRPARIRSR